MSRLTRSLEIFPDRFPTVISAGEIPSCAKRETVRSNSSPITLISRNDRFPDGLDSTRVYVGATMATGGENCAAKEGVDCTLHSLLRLGKQSSTLETSNFLQCHLISSRTQLIPDAAKRPRRCCRGNARLN